MRFVGTNETQARRYFFGNSYQIATIQITNPPVSDSGQVISMIRNDRIALNGLVIDTNILPGGVFKLGGCVAKEMQLAVNNQDGYFDGVDFKGCVMRVTVSVGDYDEDFAKYAYYMGQYTVMDTLERDGQIIMYGFDDLIKLDVQNPVEGNTGLQMYSLYNLIDTTNFARTTVSTSDVNWNATLGIDLRNNKDFRAATYRNVLAWLAEANGCIVTLEDAYLVSEKPKIKMTKVGTGTTPLLNGIQRNHCYSIQSDPDQNKIVSFPNVRYIAYDNGNHISGGSAGNELLITGNPFLNSMTTSGSSTKANKLASYIGSFSYIPFGVYYDPIPWAEAGDPIVINRKGTVVPTIITHTTFCLNNPMFIEAV